MAGSGVIDTILKILLIIVVCVAGAWGILSMVANFVHDTPAGTLPDAPDIKKAEFQVYFKATGNILYTDKYEQLSDTKYLLHGYFEVVDGKYKLHKGDLSLDKAFFGDIIISRRQTK